VQEAMHRMDLGILLAMEALEIPEGSEVITPVLTFSTTVSYIVKNKLGPVFVDVEEGTYCMNENKIKNLITRKTKAIVAPHLLGNIVNWKKLAPMLKKKGIIIIEDSADILGATINNKPSGISVRLSIFFIIFSQTKLV
jgi:CDP-6-deoxy-D-xylo-4-hexulose-3-dehydrase